MTPIRLEKKQEKTNHFDRFLQHILSRIEAWCTRHVSLLLLISVIIFSLLFVALCYAIVGVSATESGTVYNQFNRII